MSTYKKGVDRNLDMLDVMSVLAKKLRIPGRYNHGDKKDAFVEDLQPC